MGDTPVIPNEARQFSWLERQPVTLEVRGSSPLRVARTIFAIAEKSSKKSSLSKERRYASVAQLVEQGTENPRVVGSIPTGGTRKCGFSSFGRASPCQGEGGGFEPRNPLQNKNSTHKGAIFILARPTVVRARTSKASSGQALRLCKAK